MQQGRRVAGQQQLLVQAIIPQDTEEVQLVLSLLYQGVVFWVHVSLAETTFKYFVVCTVVVQTTSKPAL